MAAPRRQRHRASSIGACNVRMLLARVGSASWSDLIRHFKLRRGRSSRDLRRVVDALIASGEVEQRRDGRYALAASALGASRIAGEIVAVAGELRLRQANGEEFGLAPDSRVRPGDRVEASIAGSRALAVQVVAASGEPLVGVLRRTARAWAVESLDPHLTGRVDVVVPPRARAGDVVKVRLESVSPLHAEGHVVGVVEAGNESARAAEAMLATYRVPCSWPSDLRQRHVPQCVDAADIAGRRDLRDVPLVTIDGDDAKDFDDAVFAQPRPRGGWRLLAAIADVSHYVQPGTALDRVAQERGNSLYLPDRVVPMLPEALSNGICSLVPGQDRLAVVCDMQISANGRISRHAFFEAVVHSRARLTYSAVAAFLATGKLAADGTVAASLSALHDVYRAFRIRRQERGALDFDAREATVALRGGVPVGVEPVVRNDAHRLIEEAMIAANVAAARHLEARRAKRDRQAPPLYRVHEPPSASKLETLQLALGTVGERLPAGTPAPLALTQACERARRRSSWPAFIWDAFVLRSLAQARYEPRRLGHFGLALPTYVHFTSPIRRYADLLIHRAIKSQTSSQDELDAAAAHISMTERRAEQVERGVDAWLKCALLEDRIGETFLGTVASVTAFGLFVELDGWYVQGLLHISKLGRDYYNYVPETMSLAAERSGSRFRLGDRLRVVIEEVSVAKGRIDLTLTGRASRGRRQ